MPVTPKSKDFYLKKTKSVFTARLAGGDFDGTSAITVANLPSNIFITQSYLDVKTVTGTASTTMKIAVGSTTLVSAANVTTKATLSNAHSNDIPAGGALQLTPNKAMTSAADLLLIVEYIEYDLNEQGQQTRT